MNAVLRKRRGMPDRGCGQGQGVSHSKTQVAENPPGLALGLKRILVPTDFSKVSIHAFRYAEKLAEQSGSTVYLLHVHEPALFMTGSENLPLTVSEETLTRQTHQRLRVLAGDQIEELVPVSTQVRVGKPFEEIARFAREMKIDLIIIATHGYKGLKNLLLGRTSERVIRFAPCPVLVVH